MISDFEIMDKITKLFPNEHWFEVENMHVLLKVLNCFFLTIHSKVNMSFRHKLMKFIYAFNDGRY